MVSMPSPDPPSQEGQDPSGKNTIEPQTPPPARREESLRCLTTSVRECPSHDPELVQTGKDKTPLSPEPSPHLGRPALLLESRGSLQDCFVPVTCLLAVFTGAWILMLIFCGGLPEGDVHAHSGRLSGWHPMDATHIFPSVSNTK